MHWLEHVEVKALLPKQVFPAFAVSLWSSEPRLK